MAVKHVHLDADELKRHLKQGIDKLTDPSPFFNSVGAYLENEIVRRIDQGIEPGNAPLTVRMKGGGNTLRDTGTYMGSITHNVQPDGVLVGSPQKQARLLHEGGTIRPKKARKLAIPAYSPMARQQKRLSVRAFLRQLKASGWKVWFRENSIMGQRGRGNPVVLYVRKDAVSIPPRKHYYVDQDGWDTIGDILERYLT